MQLEAKSLLESRQAELSQKREALSAQPGLALIWIGDDPQTAAFVRAKQTKAKELQCNFFLHHFPKADQMQLEALIDGLNKKKDVHGIVLQLPLPESVDTEKLIAHIASEKDVDNLQDRQDYVFPTPAGIVSLLQHNSLQLGELKTVILGAGKLVGAPLAKLFRQNNWPFEQINRNAQAQTEQIRNHDLLISATGVEGIVSPAMVHQDMVVVDGSGIDVDIQSIEPLVKAITPKKGAIGPLTVSFLFENLLTAASK